MSLKLIAKSAKRLFGRRKTGEKSATLRSLSTRLPQGVAVAADWLPVAATAGGFAHRFA
jgi:hypothetical protein